MPAKKDPVLVFLKHFGKRGTLEVEASPPSHQMELKRSPKGSTKQHHERQITLAAVGKKMDGCFGKEEIVSEFLPAVEF